MGWSGDVPHFLGIQNQRKSSAFPLAPPANRGLENTYGVKKLENQPFSSSLDQPCLVAQNNVFLIDWLTVVFHDQTVDDVKRLLGLAGADIPWMDKRVFRHGYPMMTFWNNIVIQWGADREEFYTSDPDKSAADKVRADMGICLDMSGTGCRAFEQYGTGDWLRLLELICHNLGRIHITRLDLAYDDHIGILNIFRIEQDVRDRSYTSKAKFSEIIWSDNQADDIQGLTVQVGSKKSQIMIRIYNKAAERGLDHTKHWVRVELQLRDDRAAVAVAEILKLQHIGRTVSGILRNYCLFQVPTGDSNKSRWPIADYWDKLLMDMDKISLWISPGEPYNFSKTETHMLEQYGQAFITYYRIHGSLSSFLFAAQNRFPKLKKKYQIAIDDAMRMKAELQRRLDEERKFCKFEPIPDDELDQFDLFEIFGSE